MLKAPCALCAMHCDLCVKSDGAAASDPSAIKEIEPSRLLPSVVLKLMGAVSVISFHGGAAAAAG